jgi:hypothetical protein
MKHPHNIRPNYERRRWRKRRKTDEGKDLKGKMKNKKERCNKKSSFFWRGGVLILTGLFPLLSPFFSLVSERVEVGCHLTVEFGQQFRVRRLATAHFSDEGKFTAAIRGRCTIYPHVEFPSYFI